MGPPLAWAGGIGQRGAFMAAAMVTEQKLWTLTFLSLSYSGITIQQPGVLGVSLDTGGRHVAPETDIALVDVG